MDAKRGTIVVGASVAALVAGWFLRNWWLKKSHQEELESEEKVREFDKAMSAMNQKRKRARSTNGRHKVPTASG
jgi:hypothetical protein